MRASRGEEWRSGPEGGEREAIRAPLYRMRPGAVHPPARRAVSRSASHPWSAQSASSARAISTCQRMPRNGSHPQPLTLGIFGRKRASMANGCIPEPGI